MTVTVAHTVWVDGMDPLECVEYAKRCFTLLEQHDPDRRLDDADEAVTYAGVRVLDPQLKPGGQDRTPLWEPIDAA